MPNVSHRDWEPWGAAEVLQGAYVGNLLEELVRTGAFRLLEMPRSPAVVARSLGCTTAGAEARLRFLHHTTNILVRRRGLYALHETARRYDLLEFHFKKLQSLPSFHAAQGPERKRDRENQAVVAHQKRFAEAFAKLDSSRLGPSFKIVRVLSPSCVLDLGCGPGGLLVGFAKANRQAQGYGVDLNPYMIRTARARAKEEGVNDRMQFRQGDAVDLGSVLTSSLRSRVELIHASSLVNAFQRPDRFLLKLRRLFPGRVFVMQEYLGKLPQHTVNLSRFRDTIIHDLFQALTEQPVPPTSVAHWSSAIRKSGAKVVKCYQGEARGLEWNCHVVKL